MHERKRLAKYQVDHYLGRLEEIFLDKSAEIQREAQEAIEAERSLPMEDEAIEEAIKEAGFKGFSMSPKKLAVALSLAAKQYKRDRELKDTPDAYRWGCSNVLQDLTETVREIAVDVSQRLSAGRVEINRKVNKVVKQRLAVLKREVELLKDEAVLGDAASALASLEAFAKRKF